MSQTKASPLHKPGADTPRREVEAMLRVDHAGEHGAVRIYAGQLAVFGALPEKARTTALVKEMAAQEDKHLETFNRLLNEREVRPTALMPLWNAAGFALGAATALMGERAAMACTAAVEEAIDEHYGDQSKRLAERGDEPELLATVEEFREDELEHRATALTEGAEQAPGYPVLSALIKAGCKVAIRLSERV